MEDRERILDFQDVNERFKAEGDANDRCHKEYVKLISKRKPIVKGRHIRGNERCD